MGTPETVEKTLPWVVPLPTQEGRELGYLSTSTWLRATPGAGGKGLPIRHPSHPPSVREEQVLGTRSPEQRGTGAGRWSPGSV
jgi:hypothetical protein